MGYSVSMKRLIIVAVLAFAGLASVCAEGDSSKNQPKSNFEYEAIRKGDQYLNLSVGPAFPLFSITPTGINSTTKLNLGGIFTIGYSRFITNRISVGGEINFAFHSTLGENIFFSLPFTVKCTYEFVAKQFHFPVTINVGGAFHTYSEYNYFGPVLKPEIGAYYQYSPDWSFGITAGWIFLPEWYDNSANNRTLNDLTLCVGFRYHF